VSALSKNFVKDPREVVKPGDIVTVKVLEVDIPRKRISLTLRLDDEVGAPSGGRPGEGRGRGARTAGGGQGDRGPSGQSGRGPSGQGGRGPAGGQGGRGQGGQGGRGQGGQGGRGAGGRGSGGQSGRGRDSETSLADAFRKAGFTVH
jgi:uncharacterized protein